MRELDDDSGQVQAAAHDATRRFSAKVDLCRRALSSGDALRLRVSGTSMLPALWPGESVVVTPASIEDLQTGEVVVFACHHQRFVVHRVVGRATAARGAALLTRGDAKLFDDLPVQAGALLGRVSAVHRFGADRPMGRRLRPVARCLAWIVRRSTLAHAILRRGSAVLVRWPRQGDPQW